MNKFSELAVYNFGNLQKNWLISLGWRQTFAILKPSQRHMESGLGRLASSITLSYAVFFLWEVHISPSSLQVDWIDVVLNLCFLRNKLWLFNKVRANAR